MATADGPRGASRRVYPCSCIPSAVGAFHHTRNQRTVPGRPMIFSCLCFRSPPGLLDRFPVSYLPFRFVEQSLVISLADLCAHLECPPLPYSRTTGVGSSENCVSSCSLLGCGIWAGFLFCRTHCRRKAGPARWLFLCIA